MMYSKLIIQYLGENPVTWLSIKIKYYLYNKQKVNNKYAKIVNLLRLMQYWVQHTIMLMCVFNITLSSRISVFPNNCTSLINSS